MMRFDKHTQGVGFVFRLRHVLAKPWFINNVKYIQDWPRGQLNKSSTSYGFMGSHREARSDDQRSLTAVDHFVQGLHVAAPAAVPRFESVMQFLLLG